MTNNSVPKGAGRGEVWRSMVHICVALDSPKAFHIQYLPWASEEPYRSTQVSLALQSGGPGRVPALQPVAVGPQASQAAP